MIEESALPQDEILKPQHIAYGKTEEMERVRVPTCNSHTHRHSHLLWNSTYCSMAIFYFQTHVNVCVPATDLPHAPVSRYANGHATIDALHKRWLAPPAPARGRAALLLTTRTTWPRRGWGRPGRGGGSVPSGGGPGPCPAAPR